ncbi:unnamed protein product [Symbiodinium sp. KB8]|nr:unnamed protein product [Symbiodinium sp. KB8]
MAKASQLLISFLSDPHGSQRVSTRGAAFRNWSSFSGAGPPPPGGYSGYGAGGSASSGYASSSGYHGGYGGGGSGYGGGGQGGGYGGGGYGSGYGGGGQGGGYGGGGYGGGGYAGGHGAGGYGGAPGGYGYGGGSPSGGPPGPDPYAESYRDPYRDPYGDPYGGPNGMPPPKGQPMPDDFDEGAGEGLNMVEAGAGLPPPEEPVDEVDIDPEAMYEEEGAPEEPISEEPEAGYGEGPPLLLVNNEGQNILAKEKTRQLINKVNILSKTLQAKLPLYDEGTDLPEPEDEMREICRAREVEINKLEQAKTAAEIARLENEDAEGGAEINVEEEAKKIRSEWPGDEYDDHGGYPAPDAHYYQGYDYGGYDYGHGHGHGHAAAPAAPGPPAAAVCPPSLVAIAMLLPHLRERRKLQREAGFLSQAVF